MTDNTPFKKAVFLSFLLICFIGCARKKSVVIYHFGDVRGHYGLEVDKISDRKTGGYAVLENILKNEKKEYLLVSGGNWFLSTPEGVYESGKSAVELMNLTGVDVSGLGGMDFAFGVKSLKNIIEKAKFKVLAANLYDKKTKKPADFVYPCIIKEINGVKIGIFGLTSRSLNTGFSHRKMGGFEFRDEISTARSAVEKLKQQGAVFITALIQDEPGMGQEPTESAASYISKQVEGIDLIIVSGTDIKTPAPVKSGNTLILQSGIHLLHTGRLELELNFFTGRIMRYNYRLIDLDETVFGQDRKILSFITTLKKSADRAFGRKIALASETLAHNKGESDMGSWVCDCLRRWAKVSAVMLDSANLESVIHPGKVTLKTLYEILPYDHDIVFVKMKGADLKKILEKNITDDEKFQVSGLKIYFDPARQTGSRIEKIFINNRPLGENAIYKIAISADMLYRKNFYQAFEFANSYEKIRSKLLWCMRKEGILKIPERGRWVELKK